MPEQQKSSINQQQVDEFKADLDRRMAERFEDWPEGCFVQGPFVDVEDFEIDEIVGTIG